MNSLPVHFHKPKICSIISEFVSDWQDHDIKQSLSASLTALLNQSSFPEGPFSDHTADPDIQLTQAFSTLVKSALPRTSNQSSASSNFTTVALHQFLRESICVPSGGKIYERVSELLADTIWSIESEIEAQHSSLEEQINSSSSELSQPPDSTQHENLKHSSQNDPYFISRKVKLDALALSRKALIQLSTDLLQPDARGTVLLQPSHCRLSWEYAFLHETGLIPFTADLVAKQATRINTGLHYKQQRFNLLREESEGYSHLATELISAMGPGLLPQIVPANSAEGNPTSYPNFRSILLHGETSETRDSRIEKVSSNIKALIGFFDLDPNRTLDIILDVFCYNLTSHYPFFVLLLKQSYWMKTIECDQVLDENQIPPTDGTLSQEYGSKLIALLLGFKFTHYQQTDASDPTPDELYLMTAVLIWHKVIKLRDILPHLSPDSQAIKQYESDWRQELATKATNAGPHNALSMAGALDSSGLIGSYPKINSSKIFEASANSSTKSKALPNQKAGLVSALLSIGALQESIFILSLPNHQFLAHQDRNISALLLRLVDVALPALYRPSQLTAQDATQPSYLSLTQSKKRYAGGPAHQLVDPDPPKAILSAKVFPSTPSLNAASVKTEMVFFWPLWRDRVCRVVSNSDFLDRVWPLLRFVGPFGHMHMGVFHKVAALTAAALQDPSDKTHSDLRWNHILRWFLLPALSMTQGSVAASNMIWKVLHSYSYEERYMIYGEWKDRIYQRIPELKVERAKADTETKRVLKTMTLENLREKSRALGKFASSNPCIVFNAALNQVQTYDNLIACVIECLRYLNLFSLDVLTYSIVEFLSNPDKDRSKSDGTNIAAWLQNLAKFVGNVFKRNLSLDPAIVLQYIANQLATGNAKDLIILRDMISKMGGVDVLQDLSASQVVALGGSKTLRAEAISPTNIMVKKPSFSKSSNRLMKALTESGLTVPLLVLVTLQRQNAVLLADEGAHLKYLGVLADSCQQVLFQYIEFLRIQLTSRSISEYEKALPPMELMWGQYLNDPAIVFQVWRPVLSASIRPALKIGPDGEVIVDENLAASVTLPAVSEQSPQSITQDEETQAMDVVNQQSNEQAHYPSSLLSTVSVAEKMLPEQTLKLVGPHFFVTFWQLELYDIRMPDERYISETSRLNAMLSDLDRDYSTPMVSSLKELNRTNRSKILEIRATLTKEMKIHIKHYELTRARLASEKSFWFPLSARSPYRAQLLEHIIQHCFNPRAKLSPVDAAYTAQFIKTLHGLGTASFMTLKLLDRIFSSDVGPTIFPCSESEASNYGRFLKDLLLLVKSWYDSESAFKKTGLGKDKKGNYLPGLRMKWAKTDSVTEGIAESDMLSYENLQKVVKKWTTIMSTVCKEAIHSGEYMYIRNSIVVLKELDGLVPLFEDQANNLEAAVTELLKHEKREDVRVLVYGYQSMLKRAAKNVIKVHLPPVNKPDAPPPLVTNADAKTSTTETTQTMTIPAQIAQPLNSNTVTSSTPAVKPAVPASLSDSRPVSLPISTANRPAGLPERPSSNSSRLLPPVSRHEGDRKLPSVPPRQLNGNGPRRSAPELEHGTLAIDGLKSQFAGAPPVPSAEAAEREALARAAVQRSRKFASTNGLPTSSFSASDSSHTKLMGQQKEEASRHPGPPSAHLIDRPYLPTPPSHPIDQTTARLPAAISSGPKVGRPVNNSPGINQEDELMRPPALPSAPRADSMRRDITFYNSSGTHQHLPNHPSSHVPPAANIGSPQTRDDLTKRTTEDSPSFRSRDERSSYDRRDDRDHRRNRDDPPRTRPPSVDSDSIRSIRGGRDKDKRADRSDRSEKRKRSRSPSNRHRDHRERDRDRERDRERDKEREKDRDRKEREKDRDVRHREKEKDANRDEREKDRDRERERRSHRRDRDRDDRRHDKDREKDRERDGNNQIPHGAPEGRKVLDFSHHPSHVDDRDSKDASADSKSTNPSYNGSIPSGPRALQPTNMSPRNMRSLPTGPANYFSVGYPESSRGNHMNNTSDPNSTLSLQPGLPMRNILSQELTGNSSSDSYKTREAMQNINATDKLSRELRSRESIGSSHSFQIASVPTMSRQSGDSWTPHPLPPQQAGSGKNIEPKKNLSIRGMAGIAANALQKANEDNARKDRRESVDNPVVAVGGIRTDPIDVEVVVPRKRERDRDRESIGGNLNNSATTPTSLLSRMDDGKSNYEDSGIKRNKKDEGFGARDGDGGKERDEYMTRRTSMRESSKQDEPRYSTNGRNISTQDESSNPDRTSRLGGVRNINAHSHIPTTGGGGRSSGISEKDQRSLIGDRGMGEGSASARNSRKERDRPNSRERNKRSNPRR